MSASVQTGLRGAERPGLRVQSAVPADFGRGLRACLQAPGARLLHLARVPWLPGAEAEADLVAAFYEAEDGEVRVLAARAAGAPGRPSAAGVVGTLYEEQRLEAAGLRWAEPEPTPRVLGHGVFTFPLGPVRGDVCESAGWRLEVMGDEVLGLRLHFGYKCRGVEHLLDGAGPVDGVAVAERVTGTSPVAHATAFAMAWERLLGVQPPPTAVWWRGVLAEIERLHSHLGDLAALANSTGLPAAAAELFVLKEQVLRLCSRLTGHRYLRGVVAVGGCRRVPEAADAIAPALDALAARFEPIVRQLDASTSFLDRLHTAGRLTPEVAEVLRPVGPVGRACGLDYDVRRDRPYGLYALVGAPAVARGVQGDAWARYRVRVEEVRASCAWLRARLREGVPAGPVAAVVPDAADGAVAGPVPARVEAPRGELIYLACPAGPSGPAWVRLRPASAVNWTAVPPAVTAGNVLQDVPIVDASFSLSVSALDR